MLQPPAALSRREDKLIEYVPALGGLETFIIQLGETPI